MKVVFKIETRPIEKFMIGALILMAVLVVLFVGTTNTTLWVWVVGSMSATMISVTLMIAGAQQEEREEHMKREHSK